MIIDAQLTLISIIRSKHLLRINQRYPMMKQKLLKLQPSHLIMVLLLEELI